jgi:hypothetical protein
VSLNCPLMQKTWPKTRNSFLVGCFIYSKCFHLFPIMLTCQCSLHIVFYVKVSFNQNDFSIVNYFPLMKTTIIGHHMFQHIISKILNVCKGGLEMLKACMFKTFQTLLRHKTWGSFDFKARVHENPLYSQSQPFHKVFVNFEMSHMWKGH